MYRPPEEYYVHVNYVISYIVSSSCESVVGVVLIVLHTYRMLAMKEINI